MKSLLRILATFALALALPVAAMAAQVAVTTPSIVQWPVNAKLQLSNGSLTGTVIDCTSASSGTGNNCNGAGMIITGLQITSTDTSAQTLTCNIINTAVTYQLFVISVPLRSGDLAGTPPLAVMTPAIWPGLVADSNNNATYPLNNTDKITCTAGAITSGKLISIFLLGAAF